MQYIEFMNITDESIKLKVVRWSDRVGSQKAVTRLMRYGVSERMARYLVAGQYESNISLKKAEQIMKALK